MAIKEVMIAVKSAYFLLGTRSYIVATPLDMIPAAPTPWKARLMILEADGQI